MPIERTNIATSMRQRYILPSLIMGAKKSKLKSKPRRLPPKSIAIDRFFKSHNRPNTSGDPVAYRLVQCTYHISVHLHGLHCGHFPSSVSLCLSTEFYCCSYACSSYIKKTLEFFFRKSVFPLI